jgi:serine phosphatase RsbU (regulator of sigma subunit)
VTGLLALAFVLVLTWFDVSIPLNLRRPMVSPDGDYFAYFDRAGPGAGKGHGDDMIVSTAGGEIVARYPMVPGTISWSNAGHLMVERDEQSQATLIPNAAGSFVILATFPLSVGTHLLWARSGTKFAYVQKGKSGLQITVYDLLQTQASSVPLPAGVSLNQPILLFWSPGGQDLYFANTQGKESVLYKANAMTGEAVAVARSQVPWESVFPGLPAISPDGRRIYLPQPRRSVIDADTGQMLWTLPPDARALWSPWSIDGAAFYFSRSAEPGQIYVHDFAKDTDREMLSGVTPNGFFSDDGETYLYKDRANLGPAGYVARLREWLRRDRGWKQADVSTRTVSSLGGVELWPGAVARGGLIPASRDDYFRVRYGVFDAKTRTFQGFHVPTDRDDVRSNVDSRASLLLAVALYGLLGFFVFLARPASAPARALYILTLILMLLFISLDLARSLQAAYGQANLQARDLEFAALGWVPLLPRARWLADQFPLFLVILSCVPPALLWFSMHFPERGRFLAGRQVMRGLLYVAAFLPLAATLASVFQSSSFREARYVLGGIAAGSGTLVIGMAFLALLYNHRHPPDRRAREQVRWVLIAFSVPVVGSLLLLAVSLAGSPTGGPVGRSFAGADVRYLHGVLSTASLGPLWLFTPLAIGYALLAHKLFNIQLLFQRTLRYSLLTGVVAAVYIVLVAGMSWAIYGSLGKPSMIVLVVATLLTAIILAPARSRLERVIDRNLSREHFDFQETLQSFAQGLPGILDRRTLATVTNRTLRAAMKTQTFHLFALDRATGKLRWENTAEISGRSAHPNPRGEVEFEPTEPLCRYLVEKGRPFEVEVSPYDPKLIPIFQSAADRLSSLRAAIVFGLVWRRELVGIMALGDKITDEFYNAEDIRLLQIVARQAAIALEKTEVFAELDRKMEAAQDISPVSESVARLVPATAPQLKGCEVAGRSLAAEPAGGDYYDFLALPGDKVGVAVATVSSSGESASSLKASVQSLLRSEGDSTKDLPALVRKINRQLFSSFRGAKYCTLFYCVYDPHERRLEYVNAGHNPPLVVGPKGFRLLGSTGVPLGLFTETTHDARLTTLEQGAMLVLYSDGATSARDSTGQPFGLDRLMASVTHAGGLDASGMVEKILEDIREFAGQLLLEEDRTLVVLKVTGV